MGRLSGKKALITGGTTGIGFATAELFRNEGARVAITGQDEARVAEAGNALGPSVLALRSDAGSAADRDMLARSIEAEFGTLDVLFLNAGIGIYKDLEGSSEDLFDALFAINLKGIFFSIRRLVKIINPGGSIILTTSINQFTGMPHSHIYSAAKGALGVLIRTLAGELGPRQIRVNGVCPGPTLTEIITKMEGTAEQKAASIAALARVLALRRVAQPSEMATVALFLASDDSSFITGQDIVADGGMTGVGMWPVS